VLRQLGFRVCFPLVPDEQESGYQGGDAHQTNNESANRSSRAVGERQSYYTRNCMFRA
jgi:hypothetical protein